MKRGHHGWYVGLDNVYLWHVSLFFPSNFEFSVLDQSLVCSTKVFIENIILIQSRSVNPNMI